MTGFISLLVLSCTYSTSNHHYLCTDKNELNIRTSSVDRYKPFEYKEFQGRFYPETLYGCEFTLTSGEVIRSAYTCPAL